MASINKFEQERYEQVLKLLQQVQTINNLKQQESVINQIAVTILRSRPLCRRFNGKPLTGVYQEIYHQAKEQLLAHLRQHLIKPSRSTKDNQLSHHPQLNPANLYIRQTELKKYF